MRRFVPADMAAIEEWHEARGMKPPERGQLSTVGFIVPDVAAGWLYGTNSDVAFLDSFCTNPLRSSNERNAALDEITNALFEEARDQQFRTVLAMTREDSINDRAERHGMTSIGTFRVLRKEV